MTINKRSLAVFTGIAFSSFLLTACMGSMDTKDSMDEHQSKESSMMKSDMETMSKDDKMMDDKMMDDKMMDSGMKKGM